MTDRRVQSLVLESQTGLERHLGCDLKTALVERRYASLSGLVKESIRKRLDPMERLDISNRIDQILVNRFLGIPIFLGMMWLLFQLVFSLGVHGPGRLCYGQVHARPGASREILYPYARWVWL